MLSHQARKLDQAQFARAAALVRVTTLTSEVARWKDLRVRLADSLAARPRHSAGAIQQAALQSDWLHAQQQRTETALREATGTLQEQERLLRLARRELKKFELLRERRHRDWHKHALVVEQKLLDEVGSRFRQRSAQIAAGTGKAGPAVFGAAL